MKGKEWLKRLFYGRLAPIPRVIDDAFGPAGSMVPIDAGSADATHRMIYAIGRKQ
jgi:hypothetical protein